jgi:hypothetical protein
MPSSVWSISTYIYIEVVKSIGSIRLSTKKKKEILKEVLQSYIIPGPPKKRKTNLGFLHLHQYASNQCASND